MFDISAIALILCYLFTILLLITFVVYHIMIFSCTFE